MSIPDTISKHSAPSDSGSSFKDRNSLARPFPRGPSQSSGSNGTDRSAGVEAGLSDSLLRKVRIGLPKRIALCATSTLPIVISMVAAVQGQELVSPELDGAVRSPSVDGLDTRCQCAVCSFGSREQRNCIT